MWVRWTDPAEIQLPVSQREEKDVGHPDLAGSKEQGRALAGSACDQLADQEHERDRVGDGYKEDQADRQSAEVTALARHPPGVGDHQGHEEQNLQRGHDEAWTQQQLVREQGVERDR